MITSINEFKQSLSKIYYHGSNKDFKSFKLSNIVRECPNVIDWELIAVFADLDLKFIRDFEDKLKLKHLLQNNKLSKDLKVKIKQLYK